MNKKKKGIIFCRIYVFPVFMISEMAKLNWLCFLYLYLTKVDNLINEVVQRISYFQKIIKILPKNVTFLATSADRWWILIMLVHFIGLSDKVAQLNINWIVTNLLSEICFLFLWELEYKSILSYHGHLKNMWQNFEVLKKLIIKIFIRSL